MHANARRCVCALWHSYGIAMAEIWLLRLNKRGHREPSRGRRLPGCGGQPQFCVEAAVAS
jgi:hypothetical protein